MDLRQRDSDVIRPTPILDKWVWMGSNRVATCSVLSCTLAHGSLSPLGSGNPEACLGTWPLAWKSVHKKERERESQRRANLWHPKIDSSLRWSTAAAAVLNIDSPHVGLEQTDSISPQAPTRSWLYRERVRGRRERKLITCSLEFLCVC